MIKFSKLLKHWHWLEVDRHSGAFYCHVSGLDLDLTSHIEPFVSSDLVGRQKRGKSNSCHFDRIKLDWLKDWCMAVKSVKAQLCWITTNLVGMIRAIVANEKWEWQDLFLLQHLHLKRLTHPPPTCLKVHFHLLASSCTISRVDIFVWLSAGRTCVLRPIWSPLPNVLLLWNCC